MSKSIRYTIFILIIVIGASLGGLLLLHFKQHAVGVLRSDSLSIPVTIASTDATRQQGLSDTTSLPKDNGMLFVFQNPGIYGFWMKDMNYALDFIWLNAKMQIVTITPNVAASTYPQVFYPSQPVQYVVEVNAGFSTAHNLTVGQTFTLSH